MSKVTATSFENISDNPDAPTMARHNDWQLAISKPGEWQIEAQRGAMSVPMRVRDYYEPAEVAAYVRQQLDWVDCPPVQADEGVTG